MKSTSCAAKPKSASRLHSCRRRQTDCKRPASSFSGGRPTMLKQGIALYIIFALCFLNNLPTLLCRKDLQSTPINNKPIASRTPPCTVGQSHCVSSSPPANKYKRACNPSNRCRHGERLARP